MANVSKTEELCRSRIFQSFEAEGRELGEPTLGAAGVEPLEERPQETN